MIRIRLLRATSVVASLTSLWLLVGMFLFVIPISDTAKRADVVFVLAPAYDRLSFAEQLMADGYADTLAVSSPQSDEGLPAPDICREHRPYTVICFSPDPITTQGEARSLLRLSEDHGWESANVITAPFHITRARVLLKRCYNGELALVAHKKDTQVFSISKANESWAYHYAYETAAFVKVGLNPGC